MPPKGSDFGTGMHMKHRACVIFFENLVHYVAAWPLIAVEVERDAMARQMVNRCLDANLRYLAYLVVAADNADAAMPRRSVQVQLKRNKARPEFQLREAASFLYQQHGPCCTPRAPSRAPGVRAEILERGGGVSKNALVRRFGQIVR